MDCAHMVDAVQVTAFACQRAKVMEAQIESRLGSLHATVELRSWCCRCACWRARFLILTLVSLSAGAALGKATNRTTTINPNSAAQGTTGLFATSSVDTDSPPTPLADATPLGVVGGIGGGIRSGHAACAVIMGPRLAVANLMLVA